MTTRNTDNETYPDKFGTRVRVLSNRQGDVFAHVGDLATWLRSCDLQEQADAVELLQYEQSVTS